MPNIKKKDISQKFAGNSGCKLIIFSKKGYKVRKISNSKKNSERLVEQYQKIISFKKFQNIIVPKIFDHGIIDKKFYYDMEYFNSVNFSEMILKESYQDSYKALVKIFKYLTFCKKKSLEKNFPKLIFEKKILQLEKNIKDKDKSLIKVIKLLKKFNWKNIPASISHGDLTMENILVNNDDLIFIDLSKNFINSYYLDLSKLLFDFICCWSFRFHNDGKNNIELDSLKNRYINFLLENFDQNEIENIKMLTLIDFLRVINYTKDNNFLALLKKNINRLYDNLDNPLLW
jgi:tRNA A-37 threonylcarbamoyl transferase component Bud32|tara:strand:+ start:1668 stop:2531 length:864 start_codon:yes stop_codon:yes gene_type:complete